MKKYLLVPLTTFLVFMFYSSRCAAQFSAGTGADDFDGHAFSLLNPSGKNIRMIREFAQSNKGAENVHWYKTTDGTMTYFTINGIKSRTSYDLKGNWLNTFRSYPETGLPKDVRARVKSIYYDDAITWVNEITMGKQIVYMVHLFGDEGYRTLRVCDEEEMEITETVSK
jgi:hypothetical protein